MATEYFDSTDTLYVAAGSFNTYIYQTDYDYSLAATGHILESAGTSYNHGIDVYGTIQSRSASISLIGTSTGSNQFDGLGGYEITIKHGGTVTSYDSYGVEAFGYDNTFHNSGHIIGESGYYQAGGDAAFANTGLIDATDYGVSFVVSSAHHRLDVSNSGDVFAGNTGFTFFGGSGHFANSGTVVCSGISAVAGLVSTDESFLITNTGLISGGTNSIAYSGTSTTLLTIQNSGTLVGNIDLNYRSVVSNTGTIAGNVDTGTLTDKVFNHGEVNGDVLLWTGNDVYRGSGLITGTLDGGTGDDRFYVHGDVGAVDGGDDTDILYTSQTIDDVSNVETIILRGDNLSHIDMTVTGTTGAYVRGTGGDNELTGGDGDDDLRGLGGADTLNGGLGSDDLYGGGAADVFVFDDAAGLNVLRGQTDWIMDFAGADKIDLTGIAAFDFLGGAGFTASGGAELRYRDAAGNGELQLDIDGDGDRDVVIMVEDVTTFTANDFML